MKREMKKNIKGKQFKSNILNKVILRIDFLRIVNLEEFISELQKYLSGKEFFLTNENSVVNNVEFKINDPDMSSVDGLNVKKSINHVKVYNFQNESESTEIIISENCILFNLNCKIEYYRAKYMEIFSHIVIMAQNKFPYIKYLRIGLRKINNIIIKKDSLFYCFEKDFFQDIKLDTEIKHEILFEKRQTLDNFTYNHKSFNVNKLIMQGVITELDKNINAFNIILDIDGYLKDIVIPKHFIDDEAVKKLISSINDDIFDIFKTMITMKFINDLINGEAEKVKWGLNKNDII